MFDFPKCRYQVGTPVVPRPGNVVAVEAGTFGSVRCTGKLPAHWKGSGAAALRWLGSGGSATVFGACTPAACPHRKDP